MFCLYYRSRDTKNTNSINKDWLICMMYHYMNLIGLPQKKISQFMTAWFVRFLVSIAMYISLYHVFTRSLFLLPLLLFTSLSLTSFQVRALSPHTLPQTPNNTHSYFERHIMTGCDWWVCATNQNRIYTCCTCYKSWKKSHNIENFFFKWYSLS